MCFVMNEPNGQVEFLLHHKLVCFQLSGFCFFLVEPLKSQCYGVPLKQGLKKYASLRKDIQIFEKREESSQKAFADFLNFKRKLALTFDNEQQSM